MLMFFPAGGHAHRESSDRTRAVYYGLVLLGFLPRTGKDDGMTGTPTVAQVIAGDLARYGARRCFGLLGTANFKVSHALVEAGVELVSARHEGNAASMGDAYAKATGELTLGQRSFRSGADQCADRYRRGGEEPHTARGAGGGRADWCGEEQFLHRTGRNGARGRRGVGTAPYRRTLREKTRCVPSPARFAIARPWC